jgi:hypothetical protein
VRQSFIAQRAVEEGKGDHRRRPARFQLLQQTVQMEDVPTRLCTYAVAARTTSVQVCSEFSVEQQPRYRVQCLA